MREWETNKQERPFITSSKKANFIYWLSKKIGESFKWANFLLAMWYAPYLLLQNNDWRNLWNKKTMDDLKNHLCMFDYAQPFNNIITCSVYFYRRHCTFYLKWTYFMLCPYISASECFISWTCIKLLFKPSEWGSNSSYKEWRNIQNSK